MADMSPETKKKLAIALEITLLGGIAFAGWWIWKKSKEQPTASATPPPVESPTSTGHGPRPLPRVNVQAAPLPGEGGQPINIPTNGFGDPTWGGGVFSSRSPF